MSTACPSHPPAPAAVVLPAGTIKRIHVNQHIIRANVKQQTDNPAITVQWRGKSYVGRNVSVRGESSVVQRMHRPLSCGARIWIETSAEVEIL